MESILVRPVESRDHSQVEKLIIEHWGAASVVVHGEVYYPAELPAFFALRNSEICGLVTYALQADACEIISLDAFQPGLGIGSRLVEEVKSAAKARGCTRLHLVTTNDNLNALAFYQKRGFRLAALRPNAIEVSRRIKPEIPLVGENGIPIRDEIELEMDL
jgi:ribosomal protein S18 acetylase RimI-like enzyme